MLLLTRVRKDLVGWPQVRKVGLCSHEFTVITICLRLPYLWYIPLKFFNLTFYSNHIVSKNKCGIYFWHFLRSHLHLFLQNKCEICLLSGVGSPLIQLLSLWLELTSRAWMHFHVSLTSIFMTWTTINLYKLF